MSRKKRQYRTYSRENYDRFIKENNISPIELPYKKFCKNLEVCNWMFIEYPLRTGLQVTLPQGFGSIAVNKKMLKRYVEFNGKKYMNLRVDWNKTKLIGKKVYHTNEHTDGYNYRWLWFNKNATFTLADTYVFKPGRYASRAITKYLKKPNSPYKDLYSEWLKPYK